MSEFGDFAAELRHLNELIRADLDEVSDRIEESGWAPGLPLPPKPPLPDPPSERDE